MTLSNRYLIIAIAGLMLGVVAMLGATAADGGQANASRKCNIDGQQTKLGASYVTGVNAKRVSCGKAKKVVKAFHKCRKRNGGANGKCRSKVKGFKCNEGKRSGVKGVQYSARVSCKRGGQKVGHKYTQNV